MWGVHSTLVVVFHPLVVRMTVTPSLSRRIYAISINSVYREACYWARSEQEHFIRIKDGRGDSVVDYIKEKAYNYMYIKC